MVRTWSMWRVLSSTYVAAPPVAHPPRSAPGPASPSRGGGPACRSRAGLRANPSFPNPPPPLGPRQQVVLQELLILLQRRHHLHRRRLELAQLRRLAGQLEDAALVER